MSNILKLLLKPESAQDAGPTPKELGIEFARKLELLGHADVTLENADRILDEAYNEAA